MMQDLEKVLGDLTARERTIVCARYGIGGNVLTLQQIGEELSITRERVRQIEQKALRKLRHPSRADVVREYVDPADGTWCPADSGWFADRWLLPLDLPPHARQVMILP